jgi:DNA processing protein
MPCPTGATSLGGRTVGVLGTGIDVCYPKENKKLFQRFLETGTIISELPAGSHPAPENFLSAIGSSPECLSES